MGEQKPAAWVRILGLVVALALMGWVAFDRIRAGGPEPIFEAISVADPTLVDVAIEIENTDRFRNSDGQLEALLTLWCGTAEGQPEGAIAVVARRPRRSRPIVVEELAVGWDAALTDRQRWLLAECRRERL